MELARPVRIEAQVELVGPAELETRLGQGIVAQLRPGRSLGKIRRMRRASCR